MNRMIALAIGAAAALCGCGAPRSTFDFVLTDGAGREERVGSGADVKGEIDNAGYLALDDQSWGLAMNLGGLAAGQHDLSAKAGTLVIIRKGTGDVYNTDLGGSCTVWINPHQSSNGSAVNGIFYCRSLVSNTGKKVDVGSGNFHALINDSANNPHLNGPP